MRMDKNKKKLIVKYKAQITVLMSIILLLGYVIFSCSDNLFQSYTSEHHVSALFPRLSILGMILTMIVMVLNISAKMQRFMYQQILLFIMLISFVVIPVTLDTYPVIAGISNVIFNLVEPWRQLFVIPAFRATIVGITTALCGAVDIRATALENLWLFDLFRYKQVAIILMVFAFYFWFLAKKIQHLDANEINRTLEQHLPKLSVLFRTYPYIFVSCVLSGLNGGIFYYTYMLALKAMPNQQPSTYQYVIYIGSVVGPIIIGYLADRLGIFLMILISSILLTLLALIGAGLSFASVHVPLAYYITAFIEAALATSLWVMSAGLIGERLLSQGIFRSFAISNVLFICGNILCGYIFEVFLSFEYIKLAFFVLDLILLLLMYFTYLKTASGLPVDAIS